MACTLLENSYHNTHLTAIPLSNSTPYPAVFIFPPEEEQSCNPPWCLLNAKDAQGSLEPANVGSLNATLGTLQNRRSSFLAPAFSRSSVNEAGIGVVMPVRKDEMLAAGSESSQRVDFKGFVTPKASTREMPNQGEDPSKKTATLISRASRALQSLKNARKGSSKTNDQCGLSEGEAFASSDSFDSQQSQTPTPPSPSKEARVPPSGASRHRASVMFSQLLGRPFDAPRLRMSFDVIPRNPAKDSLSSGSSEPALLRPSSMGLCDSSSSPLVDQPPGPLPHRSRLTLSRLLLLRLHNLFASSPEPQPAAADNVNGPLAPSLPALSFQSPPDVISAATLSEPPVLPSADVSTFKRDMASDLGRLGEHHAQGRAFGPKMRLDTLRFDAISFDAHKF